MVVLVALTRRALPWALAAALLSAPWAGAQAQEPAPPAGAEPPGGAEEAITPPRPLEPFSVPYPASAPPREGPAAVKVLITIGEDGTVLQVDLQEGAGEPFDSATLEAARRFRFQPATRGATPMAVAVPFTQTFVPPPAPAALGGEPRLEALLEGFAVERGTRRPIAGAVVVARDAAGERTASTDEAGHFELGVAPGEVRVQISGAGLRPFLRGEVLSPGEKLKVKYLVERERYDPYESVVVGSRERAEISRTTLSGRELREVPGTFGDPFKVVSALPGVAQVMSLLPLPVVRGSSPGDTGVFLDGVRLPLLFHLFGGPSVIHPELVDRVDFYPGGFPVRFGGYTGGIIDGQTARPKRGDDKLEVDVNLLQAGVFARGTLPGTNVVATAAGRYGYPGLVLSALTNQLSLSYWDYQLRLDGGSPESPWTAFLLGASDAVQTAAVPNGALTTQAAFLFHRLDLRWRPGTEERNGSYRIVVGYDDSELAGGQAATRSAFVEPQASWLLPLAASLKLRAGADALARRIANPPAAGVTTGVTQATAVIQESGTSVDAGGYAELTWRPWPGALVVPGVRADLFAHEASRKWSVDPRLTARWKPWGEREVWLKAMAGRYHQPPRLFLPVPGADQSSLDLGLLASTQVGAGVEAGLAPGIELDVQVYYYNDMNPVVFDLQVNASLSQVQANDPLGSPGQLPTIDPTQPTALQRLFTRRLGRSYGLEVLLRKRDSGGVYGWLAYTLSHSERTSDAGWAAYDFDRAHILNAVAGVRLPRNWELGGRLLLQSGTPVTTLFGYNAGRSDWQFRVDLRVDKRAIWNRWLLDFYVDIVNAAVSPESGGLVGSRAVRYVLPTVGLRAVL